MNLINMLPETNGKFHLLLHEVSEFPLQPQQWEYIKADETRLYQIIDTSRRLRSRIKEIKIIPKGHTCAQQHAEQDSARTRTAPPRTRTAPHQPSGHQAQPGTLGASLAASPEGTRGASGPGVCSAFSSSSRPSSSTVTWDSGRGIRPAQERDTPAFPRVAWGLHCLLGRRLEGCSAWHVAVTDTPHRGLASPTAGRARFSLLPASDSAAAAFPTGLWSAGAKCEQHHRPRLHPTPAGSPTLRATRGAPVSPSSV